MLPQQKVSVTFTSPDKFDVKTFQESLMIRYNITFLMGFYTLNVNI